MEIDEKWIRGGSPEKRSEERYRISEIRRILEKAMAGMSINQRRVLYLRYGLYSGYEHTNPEIAAIIGCSRRNASSLHDRALWKLRKRHDILSPHLLRNMRGKMMEEPKTGDRVQVWNDDSIDCLGWGNIVDFDEVDKVLYPVVLLDSGDDICGPQFLIIKEKKAIKVGLRIWKDLFERDM